jgi:hypothetical protein
MATPHMASAIDKMQGANVAAHGGSSLPSINSNRRKIAILAERMRGATAEQFREM